MTENVIYCPVCESDRQDKYISCIDYVGTDESFNISLCKSCGFKFTNPRPKENECSKYYISKNYVSHTDIGLTPTIVLYRWARNFMLAKKLKWINNIHTGNNINLLDYGCGLGTFLNYTKLKKWNVVGVDTSENAKKEVKKRYNIDVFNIAELSSLPNNNFSVITLWHVLEHVYSLNETVEILKDKLTADGHIFIAVPNCGSYDAKVYKEKWDAYDVPRHIWHFRREDIKKISEKNGMKLVETHGMPFDAYYVSIRSEKHKNSYFSFIRGIWTGLISNIKARKLGEYSSVLYILKK